VFSKIATFTRSISNIVKDGSINALAAIGKYLSIKIYKALDDTLDKKNPELPNKFYESLYKYRLAGDNSYREEKSF